MLIRIVMAMAVSVFLAAATGQGQQPQASALQEQSALNSGAGATARTAASRSHQNEPAPDLASEREVGSHLAKVSGVSIKSGTSSETLIDVETSRSTRYRTFQLSNPERLVVDVYEAREATPQEVYPAEAAVLKRVRVGQWQQTVVRVVADLEGSPTSKVQVQPDGILIKLTPGAPQQRKRVESARGGGAPVQPPSRSDSQPVFAASGLAAQTASLTTPELTARDRRLLRQGESELAIGRLDELARVSGIDIKHAEEGKTLIDIATSRATQYRVFHLADPSRLVVDLEAARKAMEQGTYAVRSDVLQRVRVGQWKENNPSVVRVVADLEGQPTFDVRPQSPGVRIELQPRHLAPTIARNPFEYLKVDSLVKRLIPQLPEEAVVTKASLTASVPGVMASDLKFLGFIEKNTSDTEAVVSDDIEIHFLHEGESIEGRFRVLKISARAVEIEDTLTSQTLWLKSSQ
jgi:AMIN domain-containing protein